MAKQKKKKKSTIKKKKRRMLEKRKVNEQKSIGHPKGLLAYKDPGFSKDPFEVR